MVPDTISEVQGRLVIAIQDKASHRRLLIGHADGAIEHGPAFSVPRIEGIKNFAREIVKPEPIEPLRVVAPHPLEPFHLLFCQQRIQGIRRRGKVVGRVPSHLVQVHKDLREPLQVAPNPASGFGLCQGEPVPVHVEEIMIASPPGPGFVVFGRGRMRVRPAAASLTVVLGEAIPSVRILLSVDDHDTMVQNLVDDAVPGGRRQMIRRQQSSLGTGNLIAMDPIGQPDDGGQIFDHPVRLVPGDFDSANLTDLFLDIFQSLLVRIGCDNQIVEFPPFPGPAIRHSPDS